MDFLKVLRAFLTTAYKMSEGDIDAILSASGEDQTKLISAILEKDTARVQAITDAAKPPAGQTFKDGEGKGKKEALTAFEKSLKDKFGIESELTGLELVQELLTSKSQGGQSGDLTDEKVKTHPVYQQLEKAMKKAVQDKDTEWQAKLAEQEAATKKADTHRTVQAEALKFLQTLNPAIPKNELIAQNMQKGFLGSLLNGIDYTVNDDGSIVPMKDGKVMTDAHGHTLPFSDLVKTTATGYYEFAQNNGGGNGGNGSQGQNQNGGQQKNAGQGGGSTTARTTFKNEADFFAYTRDTNVPIADRLTAQEAWDAQHADA